MIERARSIFAAHVTMTVRIPLTVDAGLAALCAAAQVRVERTPDAVVLYDARQ